MKYKKGDKVIFEIVAKYKERSVEYKEAYGTIVEVHKTLNAYDILPDEYDKPFYIPERNILGKN